MPSAAAIAADLVAEQTALDRIVDPLVADQWRLDTPSPGWRIADQIAHLAYFDHTAALAITDAGAFAEHRERFFAIGMADTAAIEDLTLAAARELEPDALLEHWRAARSELAAAATTLADDTRIEWYGPSMGARSFLTARLMEVWAHGQDIVDALGIEREPTDRIRHIAQLGFITRGWTYVNRGLPVPETDIRVELTAPSGGSWVFGPDDAAEVVTGPALDFVLVTTQRRHPDDTELVITGPTAQEWLLTAQAFAGPPTDGPAPRSDGPDNGSGDA